MYVRRYTRGDSGNDNESAATRNGNRSIHFFDRPGEGLDRALIDDLPLVSFTVVKTLKEGKEDFECAVCLEKFQEDESLRLLPKCSHVFHTECIDVWFLSHSTCPLCRMSLKPTVAEIHAGVPEVGEVSRRILEAQEEMIGSARRPTDEGSVINENDALGGSRNETVLDTDRDNERSGARLALFRNSNSFRQAARGVEVRERLATLSSRYPTSSADVHKDPQRALSLSCLSFQRTRSLSAGGTGDFYNGELFKYGSQRYGLNGSPLSNSLGRLCSLNERELQGTGDLSRIDPSATLLEEGSSSSASSEHWTTVDLNGVAAHPHPSKTEEAVILANTQVSTTPGTQLPKKPRSGPLPRKQVNVAHNKSGSAWERLKMEGGSFRGLRDSFPLHRSASEGRPQSFAIDLPPTAIEPAVLDVCSTPRADATPPADTDISLAQRTMQWLSGGHGHTFSATYRTSLDQKNALQQIVTEG